MTDSPTSPPQLDPPQDREPNPHFAGVDVIKAHLKHLPAKPGVYRMYGIDGDLLYVGKARVLKNRVANYAKLGGHTQRIARMISLTRSMEFVVTESETEALLLEANLIKKLKPRFNILLRDDKSFPYILIRRDHDAPQILKHRGAKKTKGDYFGPFASGYAVNETLDILQKAFLLRTCTDSVYEGRSRACMQHQIKRCSAPCVDLISKQDYDELANQAALFLQGKATTLQDQLAQDMERASEDMEFEKAAILRDRIKALAAVRASQTINPADVEEADIFAIETKGGQTCVQAFFIRAGQNWGATAYYPRHDMDDTPEDILAAFLVQFYDSRPVPKLILTSVVPSQAKFIAEALELRTEYKVYIHTPARGAKLGLVKQAHTNAREALARKLAQTQSQGKILTHVQKVFDLSEPPKRIEVYDNSHIQGSNAVGGMIVANSEGFDKSSYRKFNIKDTEIEPGDDYGMMREVMRRRFARLKKEAEGRETKPDTWPDLVLIDGGLGQLSAVIEALADVGFGPHDLNLVAIAKGPDRNAGREQFFRPGRAPFQMPINDPALYYLQRLRDEAHRWAIGAHRAKRSADIKKNPLDDIGGIGPTRKKALLHHFGSAKGISNAKLVDLEAVEGVSAALAQKIYDHFQN
ncbi:excinuclease ABC subunit UvrC [Hirschia litorea]|uniref:UvrABC system protein C n=1 Tax=Hirschia litorea TaxID=1199156 RepID=A0ABW2IKG6_9PROT